MPQTLSRALRIRLAHSDALRQCLSDAHWISGLHAVFLCPEGEVLGAYPRKWDHPFCNLLRTRSVQHLPCSHCEWVRGDLPTVDLNAPACPALLTSLVHEIRVENQLVARIALMSYREAHRDLQACQNAWIRLARESVAISWTEWKAAWNATVCLNENQVVALRRWLRLAVQEVMKELDTDPRLRGREPALPGLVHRTCAIVRQHYMQPLRLSGIAEQCGVSAEHLSRVFHQSTGLRFRDYLAEVRLNEASRLLMEGNTRIAEVAECVGHNSLSRFNRAFKSYTGMTPGAWRRRSRSRHWNRNEDAEASGNGASG